MNFSVFYDFANLDVPMVVENEKLGNTGFLENN
jgi:hypothetical protein